MEKFSRQIGTLGKETMEKVSELKILVIGCDTVGTECCKSLALMGIKELYLCDSTLFSSKYNGRLIYKPTSSKMKLHDICSEFINVLNPEVKVSLIKIKEKLKDVINLKSINAVINTDNKQHKSIEEICINQNVPYIFGYNSEFIGYIFVNFGKKEIKDIDGESVLTGYIDKYEIDTNTCHLLITDIKKIPVSREFVVSNEKNVSKKIKADNIVLIKDKIQNTSSLKISINNENDMYSDDLFIYLKESNNITYSSSRSSSINNTDAINNNDKNNN